MRKASWIAAGATVVVANLFALVHAARNRAGAPEAEITLTNREVAFYDASARNDNSGVTLHLRLTDPNQFPLPGEPESHWLDRQKLTALGFDCSVDPNSRDAERFYQRQRPHRAFVAAEYDGAAWRAWLDSYERGLAAQRSATQLSWPTLAPYQSHLVAIDADRDAGTLRARYPDRTTVLILPAVIAIKLHALMYPGMKVDPQHAMQILGQIQQYPADIQVPHPWNEAFRNEAFRRLDSNRTDYRVHLRYGSALEPWVTGVEVRK